MKRVKSLLTILLLSCAALAVAQNRVVNTGTASRTVINLNDTTGGGTMSIWEQLEQERVAQEKAEQLRQQQEQAEREAVEKARQEREEQERLAAEQRVQQEKAEQERLAAEKARQKEQERIAAEQRLQQEKAEQEHLAAEKARQKEQERLAAEQRLQQEKAEQERLAAEKAQQKELARQEAERQAALRQAYQDSAKAVKKERFAEWKNSFPMSHILMANGAFALYPEYAFGLTYGQVHIGGWYVNVMLNANIHATSTDVAAFDYPPFYTGRQDAMRLSATIGGLVRLYVPVYFYAGVGYGYRAAYFEDIEHQWIRQSYADATPGHGVHWELGLTGNIKGFSLSAGLSAISGISYPGTYYEAKIGIGCFINQKAKK